MAFIRCPYCHLSISDQDQQCPHCHRSVKSAEFTHNQSASAPTEAKKERKLRFLLLILPILLIVLSILLVLLHPKTRKQDQMKTPPVVVKPASQNAPVKPADAAEEQLAAPPLLPTPPLLNSEPEAVQKEIDRIFTFYPDQLVTAYFLFCKLRDQDKDPPSDSLKAWLDNIATLLRPYGNKILLHDQNTALKISDLHLYMISAFSSMTIENPKASGYSSMAQVVEKLADGSEERRRWEEIIDTLANLKKKALEGAGLVSPIWKITELGETRMESYTSDYPVRISAQESSELLRVQAKVENISPDSDPDYAPWSKGGLSGELYFKDSSDFPERPRRFISDNSVWVVDGAGTWFPCLYTSQKCPTLVGYNALALRMFLNLGKKVASGFSTGTFVAKNKPFVLDVLFSVPKGSGPYRLLIIGSPPQDLAH